MTNHGDDCYFFYYSTCTKGDSCPFRHCEAAMGNETVCSLWQEGRCFRPTCKFRHMEMTKNRKEIACYWENQPTGCQKPHCAFFHEKPRYVDGAYLPPNKTQTKTEDLLQEEAAPPPAAPLPTANPQLRGVKKAETLETVPSPTHPPVVINPADDDEDEDDQFSEEGEEVKLGPDGSRLTSPRKTPAGCSSEESLNFGVSTLEEIRLRKALKASMKRAGYPLQTGDTAANGQKENIRSPFLPALYETGAAPLVFEETGRLRGNVAERLGRKIIKEVKTTQGATLRSSLADRLGKSVDDEVPLLAPQKALKSIKERLSLPAEPVEATQSAENSTHSKKTPEQIRIKTLEEIRKEKAAKLQSESSSDSCSEITITKTIATKAPKATKRAITIKDASVGQVKTFSEILHAKRKMQEAQQEQNPKKIKPTAEKVSGKVAGESDAATPNQAATDRSEVRVKTLEEIRREKAAKTQAQQALEGENKKSTSMEETDATKPRLLRIKKLTSNTGGITTQPTAETPEKPAGRLPADAETSVKVKTFEEIMREKRLRKQEMEEQASSDGQPAEAENSHKQTAGTVLKRKAPTKDDLTPPPTSSLSSTASSLSSTTSSLSSAASSLSSTTSSLSSTTSSLSSAASSLSSATSNQKAPVRKRISLKSKAASPINSAAAAAAAAAVMAVSVVSGKQNSPPCQAEAESTSESSSGSKEPPHKKTRSSPALSPAKQARGVSAQSPTAIKTQNNTQRKSPEQPADAKVRPKLNVKPSVLKPAVQLKSGQKGKAAERSAVAAVRPLTSAAAATAVLQETPCRDREVLPSSSPTPPSDSSTRGDELHALPVFQQNPDQTKLSVSAAAAVEDSSPPVPQSPVVKTSTQSKSRRPSLAASRISSAASVTATTSAVDDFEDLINEFTDDHLENDVDPGIAEDDLLQELSEMIDS